MYNKLNKSDLLVQTCYKKNMPSVKELKKLTKKEIINLLNNAESIKD